MDITVIRVKYWSPAVIEGGLFEAPQVQAVLHALALA